MIQALLDGLLNILTGMIGLLVSPIDAAIQAFFPDVSGLLGGINSFLTTAQQFLGIVVSWTFIPTILIQVYFLMMTAGLAVLAVVGVIGAFNWIKTVKFW